MKKKLAALFVFFAAGISFAGDAAAFKDIGFSSDGRFYIFGQYGKTDKKFQPYAEIYTVDVERNEFVPGCVYKNFESKSDKSGRAVYEELYANHCSEIKARGCKSVCVEDVLYVLEDAQKKPTEEIVFKNIGEDAEKASELEYSVRLIPSFEGCGAECRSKFYIDLVLRDKSGADKMPEKCYKIGSPDIRRKGVTAYKIVRIFRDQKRSSLVFVVEKTVEDFAGTSIRYMVETVKL